MGIHSTQGTPNCRGIPFSGCCLQSAVVDRFSCWMSCVRTVMPITTARKLNAFFGPHVGTASTSSQPFLAHPIATATRTFPLHDVHRVAGELHDYPGVYACCEIDLPSPRVRAQARCASRIHSQSTTTNRSEGNRISWLTNDKLQPHDMASGRNSSAASRF